jgi:hypothetical protein
VLPCCAQTVEGDVSVIFSAEEMEEVLAKNKDKLVVLFCGLTWCRYVLVVVGLGVQEWDHFFSL